MSSRQNHSSSKNKSNRKTTPLGLEQLESRMMNAVSSLDQHLQLLLAPNQTGATHLVGTPVVNSAPTIAAAARLIAGSEVRGQSATVTVVGADNGGEANLTYTWLIISAPSGVVVDFDTNGTNAAKTNTLTFHKAGSYAVSVRIQDQFGLATTSTLRFNVIQTLTSMSFTTTSGQPVSPTETLNITTTNQRLLIRGVDQFGAAMAVLPTLTWTKIAGPSDATISASISGGVATVLFNKTGAYQVSAQSGGVSSTFNANVIPTLSSISIRNSENRVIAQNTAVTITAASQRWSAVALDQFNAAMTDQPTVDWTVVNAPLGGTPTIRANGNDATIAFGKSGSYTFRARVGSISAQLSVNVAQVLTSIQLYSSNGDLIDPNVAITSVGTNQRLTVRGYDQFGQAIASLPTLSWATTSVPSGGSASGTLSAGVATLNFTRAGTYRLVVGNGTTSTSFQVTVLQTLTTIAAVSSENRVIATSSPLTVTGTSQTLQVSGLDQFGQSMLTQPRFEWATVNAPIGSSATLQTSGNSAVISFDRAGSYLYRVSGGSMLLNISLIVVQRLSSISIAPGNTRLDTGATQQFTGQALDQFNQAMNTSPNLTWTATGGTVSATGFYTAGSAAGSFTLCARSGMISGAISITISIAAVQSGLHDANLRTLFDSLYVDGAINRTEMMQILRSAGSDGAVDQTELTDLRWLVSSTNVAMPSYVRELARDVVNENVANRTYQGSAAGNLVAGSRAGLLNNLVDKWFLGTDVPALTNSSLTYQYAAGNLFNGNPSQNDTRQGAIGDCYFISAIAAIADRNAEAVRNMFIDNGDSTFTVRFYAGALGQFLQNGLISAGFLSGSGIADYVTVNRRLPTINGTLAYSGAGQSAVSSATTLWIALAEKAYAQWNETGNEGRDGSNSYRGIEGGWMSNVNAQVLGFNSTNYALSSTAKQTLISALAEGRSVTIGTLSNATAGGLVGSHAYIVSSYSANTDTFSLHNPWGFRDPTALTWDQLRVNCSAFTTSNPAGSTAISLNAVRDAATENLIGNWTTVVTTASSPASEHGQMESDIQGEMTSPTESASQTVEQRMHEWITMEDEQPTDMPEMESMLLSDLRSIEVDFAMSMVHLDSILS